MNFHSRRNEKSDLTANDDTSSQHSIKINLTTNSGLLNTITLELKVV
jgi:hypothetical protein